MKPTIEELLDSLPPSVVHHIQHLERMRQDFVANVSHELRTPLTVIHGYLEILLNQDFDGSAASKKILGQMQEQTLRMQNLIENLLLLSRLENEEIGIIRKDHVDVSRLLESIYEEAKQLSGKQHHQIYLKADPTLNLLGSQLELRSLFSNLIFNAIKYTPQNGHIEIEWFKQNQQAVFKVTDNGIGIAPEHIPRLTERFYRVDPARSRASGGTGLGLAIVKHVIIRHQAQLDVKSELGKGSVFACIFNC